MIDSNVKRVIVVGGGYIGIEVGEALVDRGIEVTMVTSGRHVLERTLDDEMGGLVDDAVRSYGIELHTELRVRRIEGTERATGIGCDGLDLDGDLIVIGLGAGPEVELAKAGGIPLGESGAIAVDEFQRTSVEGIWSAGDCAEVLHRVNGKPVNIALGTVANKTGRIAGTNIAASINGTPPETISRGAGHRHNQDRRNRDLENRLEGEPVSRSRILAGGRNGNRNHNLRLLAHGSTDGSDDHCRQTERGDPRRPGRRRSGFGKEDRRDRDRHLEWDDGRRVVMGRPGLRPTVQRGLGLDPHRGAPGGRGVSGRTG